MSNKKEDFVKTVLKLFMIVIFISFLTLYLSQKSG